MASIAIISIAIITLLARISHRVTANLVLAGGTTAVARNIAAIVTLLARVKVAIAAVF